MKKLNKWILLGGLFVIYCITNGVVLNTLPIFYPELSRSFGWNQAEVTAPAQLLFFSVALLSPLIGLLLDISKARLMMMIGTGFIMVAFLFFSRMTSLTDFKWVYILFAMGITLAGIIPSMRIITYWFNKSRGLAVGILLVGSSMGGAIFNQVTGSLLPEQGWRNTVFILGIVSTILILIPLIFLVKDRPVNITDSSLSDSGMDYVDQNVGLKEALSSRNFYLLLFITGVMWFCIVGVIQHQTLYFEDFISNILSKDVLSIFFLSSIAGKILFGRLADIYEKRNIMFFAVINLTVGALLLKLVPLQPSVFLWMYAVVFGVGFSGTFTMIQLLVAQYYGGHSYGRILGIVTMVDTLAGVGGIMVLGKLRAAHGSYSEGLLILIIISAMAGAMVLLLRNPKPSIYA
ncbi:MAG TPA: MFS transporter [Saprospiraceae bacterium]|nr:MFS transporter [Saprospiraceae bacterium]